MTKTKFSVEIHSVGSESDSILRVIGNANAGLSPISLVDIQSYMTFKKGQFPSINGGYYATRDEDNDNILRISEDGGKTWILTIEQREVHELKDILDIIGDKEADKIIESANN